MRPRSSTSPFAHASRGSESFSCKDLVTRTRLLRAHSRVVRSAQRHRHLSREPSTTPAERTVQTRFIASPLYSRASSFAERNSNLRERRFQNDSFNRYECRPCVGPRANCRRRRSRRAARDKQRQRDHQSCRRLWCWLVAGSGRLLSSVSRPVWQPARHAFRLPARLPYRPLWSSLLAQLVIYA
jgi:hypothetical protein